MKEEENAMFVYLVISLCCEKTVLQDTRSRYKVNFAVSSFVKKRVCYSLISHKKF